MSISKLKFYQSSLTPLEAFSKHRGRIPPSANKVQVHGVCTQERVSLQASQSSHEQQLQLATVNILAEDAVFMCLVGVRLSARVFQALHKQYEDAFVWASNMLV